MSDLIPDEEREELIKLIWGDAVYLEEIDTDVAVRRILAAGFRRVSPVTREALIDGLEIAMLGTEGGDLIDPTSDVPAGEMFRLAKEYLLSVSPPAEVEEKVRSALNLSKRIVDMYRHLVMDTPEDQRLHESVTAAADRGIAAAIAALGVPVSPESEGKK